MGMMKKQTLDTLRALALLAFFVAGATAGLLLIWSQFGTWEDPDFWRGWRTASPAGASASYLVFIGFGIFALCAICVIHVLRHDLQTKRRGRK
jgi:hypothetical protein